MGATTKRRVPDGGDTVRDSDARQADALLERTPPYVGYGLVVNDGWNDYCIIGTCVTG